LDDKKEAQAVWVEGGSKGKGQQTKCLYQIKSILFNELSS